MLTLKELTVGNFVYNVSLPWLENYIYRVHYVEILSNSKPRNIFSTRDYVERMSANFNIEILSENFGNTIDRRMYDRCC